MASQLTNYQCPACTGPLHYDGKLNKLVCDYCGSSYTVAEIEALFEEKEEKAKQASAAEDAAEAKKKESDNEWDMDAAGDAWGADADGLKAYNCPSCGAELICDATTAATSCPYCGNPTVVPGKLSGTKKPDYVIPFKLDKDAAVAALKAHYKGKILLPKAFSNQNHIEEIKGVYVPFWLFDGEADADIVFNATRSTVRETHSERITRTEHFKLYRSGSVPFKKVPVDASSKMPDAHMDSIEPYDYSELTKFSTAYLPGYLADQYDVSQEECAKRADERCTNTAISALQNTALGYETCMVESSNVNIRRGDVKYAMLPVWMLSTKWKGQNYLFAMNGQTGKLIGDLPVDKGRYWGLFGGIFAGLAAVLGLILFL
ncbi:MAG: hypothetical protein MJ118_06145 [Clostridia bacterium]|nr:hypothetical protein [Clostridia bacterium]